MAAGLSKAEKEHILRWSDDPEDALTFYTHKKSAADRLLRAGARLKRVSKIAGEVVSWTIECPREWVRWPAPRRRRKVGSEAQAALSGRLQKAREAKKRSQITEKSDPEGRE